MFAASFTIRMQNNFYSPKCNVMKKILFFICLLGGLMAYVFFQ